MEYRHHDLNCCVRASAVVSTYTAEWNQSELCNFVSAHQVVCCHYSFSCQLPLFLVRREGTDACESLLDSLTSFNFILFFLTYVIVYFDCVSLFLLFCSLLHSTLLFVCHMYLCICQEYGGHHSSLFLSDSVRVLVHESYFDELL
jgi:hypothetical protein